MNEEVMEVLHPTSELATNLTHIAVVSQVREGSALAQFTEML